MNIPTESLSTQNFFVDFGEGVTSETIINKGLDGKAVTILCNYPAFQSNDALYALFKATPLLSPWQHSIPEADSRSDRVFRLYAFLIDQKHSSGVPALEIFLKALRDTKGGDILFVEKKTCAKCSGEFIPQTAPGSAIRCPTCGSQEYK